MWAFWGWVFLDGCTQKNPVGFFGCVPGCLNPGSSAEALVSLCVVRCYWHCGWLLLGSCCPSSAGVRSSECVLRGRGSGPQRCSRLHATGRCHGHVPGCQVPTDLWHDAEEVLPRSCGCSVCRPDHNVYSRAGWTCLPNTYVIFLTDTFCCCSKK